MKKVKISNILIGILFTLFFISIGVIASINSRFVYYLDINLLNIPESSGMTRAEIIANYDALIDYNSPFFKGDLVFPTLPASPSGLEHFIEVKQIFTAFYYIAGLTFVTILIIILYKKKKKDYSYLRTSAITVIVLPILVGLACAVNFDRTFILFHKIFFRNDYWLFDPVTDPIINILPDTFFLHCLIEILIFVILGSIALFSISHALDNKRRKELLL